MLSCPRGSRRPRATLWSTPEPTRATPDNKPRKAVTERGIRLEVVKVPEAKKGLLLLPRRWVVERSFAWASRFRRLARVARG